MKTTMLIVSIMILGISNTTAQTVPTKPSFDVRKETIKNKLKDYVSKGLPGVTVAYWSEDQGTWLHSEGYSNLENQVPMRPEQLFYLQSISKTYMAVAIMALVEEGKLDLDDTIDGYVNTEVLGLFANQGITIRMLLNHTSGIPDYASDEVFVAKTMEHLTRFFTVEECLATITNKDLDFSPSTDYAYSNTNYALLSMIADKVTGNHVSYIKSRIFERLGLADSYYLTPESVFHIQGIVDSYWDPLNLERPINISTIQKVNVASLRGDDGIVCSPWDGLLFLRSLVRGEILEPETLEEMKQWVTKDGVNRYGLGLTYYPLENTYAIGHSGGGLGAGCILLYLPKYQAYVFVATNFSTMIEGKITEKCSNLVEDILDAFFY